ncbi:hypothetical protein PM082_003210 [Marasmius tenuissimus]|nr:hypothetical protein PM082_003210 [Marasmius tenuissimus]
MSLRTGFIRASSSSRCATSRNFSRPNSSNATSRIQHYVDTLISAKGNRLDVISQYYPALAREASQLQASLPSSSTQPQANRLVSPDYLESMLQTLAAAGRPADLKQIEDILADMTDVFNTPPTPETHSAIIRGLLRCQKPLTIIRWLESMPEKPGGVTPTLEHYHMFLEASPQFTSFKNMQNIVLSMSASGCSPTNETYKLLLRGLWTLSASPPPPSHIATFLWDMRERELGDDPSILSFISNEYRSRGLTKWASEIATTFNQILGSHHSPHGNVEKLWSSRFSNAVTKRGLHEALELYPEFLKDGGKPSSVIFNSLLRHSCSLEDMQTISKALGIEPTRAQWSMIISDNCKRGRVQVAQGLYAKARDAGVQPYAPMNGPLIRGLFRNASTPISSEVIDAALEIYDDLHKAIPMDSPVALSTETHNEGPDFDIYTELFHGLSLAQDPRRYASTIKALTEDMKARGIEIHGLNASMAVMRMRSAPNEEEAYNEYLRRRSALDQTGYERVLDAFCGRCLNNGAAVPSISRYFSIVSDLRKAGYQVTSNVYAIILRYLGRLGTQSRRYAECDNLRSPLISATRRIHDLITLDAAFSPDCTLWNQLMDTYQRLGLYGDSYRVWDQMYISKNFDHVSVSVVFDACGFGKLGHLLEETRRRLARDRFQMNLHNWNTYIESLCRMGKLNEALKVLCLEMTGDTRPTPESATIVRSFARRPELDREIMNRIERHQPQLYELLERRSPREDGTSKHC